MTINRDKLEKLENIDQNLFIFYFLKNLKYDIQHYLAKIVEVFQKDKKYLEQENFLLIQYQIFEIISLNFIFKWTRFNLYLHLCLLLNKQITITPFILSVLNLIDSTLTTTSSTFKKVLISYSDLHILGRFELSGKSIGKG